MNEIIGKLRRLFDPIFDIKYVETVFRYQVWLSSVYTILSYVVLGFTVYRIFIYSRKVAKGYCEMKYCDEYSACKFVIIQILTCIFIILYISYFISTIFNVITGFVNPDYLVIKEFMSLTK